MPGRDVQNATAVFRDGCGSDGDRSAKTWSTKRSLRSCGPTLRHRTVQKHTAADLVGTAQVFGSVCPEFQREVQNDLHRKSGLFEDSPQRHRSPDAKAGALLGYTT